MNRTIAITCTVAACLALAPSPAGATFPGANGRIAFYTYGGDPSRIASVNPDGSGRSILTGARHDTLSPAWSPDGEQIAYVVLRPGPDRLVVMTADGASRNVLFERRRWPEISAPAWSPDGAQLAISARARRGVSQILIVEVADASFTVIHSDTFRVDPDWSPDGTRIAFQELGDTIPILKIMDPDGSDVVTVIAHGVDPTWSPDATRIAYVDTRGRGPGDVFVIDSDGTARMQLTDTPRRWEYTPAFSPDGDHIAFSRTIGADFLDTDDIWIMDADGANAMRITETPRIDEFGLTWQTIRP